jgi:small subunit ribosomal protein S5
MSFLFRARCLFRTSSTSNLSHPTPCRKFHISSNLLDKRRPPVAPDTDSISSNSTPRSPHEIFRPYSEKEKAALAKKYTPEQLQAIEEGEAAIDPEDILKQGNFRTDPYKLPYLDDLSIIRPVIDKKPREAGTIPDNARSMTEDEAADDVSRWLVEEFYESRKAQARGTPSSSTDTPIKPSRLDFRKYLEESTSMTGGGKRGSSVIAPALPKDPELKAQYQMSKNIDPRDPDGKWVRLQKQTGLTLDEILDYKIKVLVSHRVVNQTRLGKIQSMYVLAVAGDGHGRLGIGEGKATEIEEATDKARQAAVRNMRPIPRYEERTIFGEVEGKVAACEVQLMARPPGTFY